MPATLPIMSLHLHYRLCIAEMNFYINVLRIFDDYVKELSDKKDVPDITKGIDHFKKEFIESRKEMDELRHQMHLAKMKLAAFAKTKNPLDFKEDEITSLKHKFETFKKSFAKLRTEFTEFEAKWL